MEPATSPMDAFAIVSPSETFSSLSTMALLMVHLNRDAQKGA